MKFEIYKGKPLRECCKVIRNEWPVHPKWHLCSRYTAFLINGNPYCKFHAGEIALKEAIKKSK